MTAVLDLGEIIEAIEERLKATVTTCVEPLITLEQVEDSANPAPFIFFFLSNGTITNRGNSPVQFKDTGFWEFWIKAASMKGPDGFIDLFRKLVTNMSGFSPISGCSPFMCSTYGIVGYYPEYLIYSVGFTSGALFSIERG